MGAVFLPHPLYLTLLILSVIDWQPHPQNITKYKMGNCLKQMRNRKTLSLGFYTRDIRSGCRQSNSHVSCETASHGVHILCTNEKSLQSFVRLAFDFWPPEGKICLVLSLLQVTSLICCT